VARIALHRGEIHKALRLLRRTLAAAEEAERTRGVVQTLVLQALTHQAQGDEDQPMASLERALILAEPEDSVRTFLDEGLFMAELLRIALSEGVVPVTPLAPRCFRRGV